MVNRQPFWIFYYFRWLFQIIKYSCNHIFPCHCVFSHLAWYIMISHIKCLHLVIDKIYFSMRKSMYSLWFYLKMKLVNVNKCQCWWTQWQDSSLWTTFTTHRNCPAVGFMNSFHMLCQTTWYLECQSTLLLVCYNFIVCNYSSVWPWLYYLLGLVPIVYKNMSGESRLNKVRW